MQASDIFSKTPKGLSEISSKSDALTMKERRVLILVNGENDVATLERLSLSDDINAVLKRLLQLDFIGGHETTIPAVDYAGQAARPKINARELMCNTLLTFGNRVRVAGLIEKINASEDAESLTQMVQPWYQAIADTPGGMYEADALKKKVEILIMQESSAAG